ncbi:hypothetical protein RBEAN4_0052 [Rickettsia bellii str. RML An4]|uniref:Uncharacterized protein n=1 Tax=Rickettsia bellii str. RML An4 TaxID=1359193 RepID=A0A0F3Q945_RICBE|nr:hypothetical protein RBEAN4_0052 [Rickettsia bellii str. RML An4]
MDRIVYSDWIPWTSHGMTRLELTRMIWDRLPRPKQFSY